MMHSHTHNMETAYASICVLILVVMDDALALIDKKGQVYTG